MFIRLGDGPTTPRIAVCLVTALWALAAGCHRDEPPSPPVTQPAVGGQAPQASPVPLRPKPDSPLAAPAKAAPAPSPAVAPARQRPAGADAKDAANAPGYLPRSGECGSWVKREPITVVPAGELSKLVASELAAKLSRFELRSAASCAYACTVDGKEVVAHVLAIETAAPEDAYGLVTCASSSPRTDRCGGLTRVETGPGVTYHTWQGRVYLKASIDVPFDGAVAELRRLAQHVASRIQREDEPALVHALPTDSRMPGRLWIVRHPASLPQAALGSSPPPDIEATARLGGLGPDTLMCVAQYDVPHARQPNTVWVIRYPSPAAAREAHRKLQQQIQTSDSPSWQLTNILPPKGAYVIGTWTAEEESLQYAMPRIASLLPG